MDDKKEIGKRCRRLRKKANLTQDKLNDELQKIIAKNEGTVAFKLDKDDDSGKQPISKIENGNGLSLRYGLAYSEYFNVSLDYLYLGTTSYKPVYDDIKKLTGLSDDALNILEKLKKSDKTFIFVLNKFLSPDLSHEFINLLHSFFNHYNLKVKNKLISSEYAKYISSKGAKIENVDNFYREFYPKEREYISLYKISIESNELANKFKKYGDK